MTTQPQFVRHKSTKARRRIFDRINSYNELIRLTPEAFAACCAYLYEAEGYRVLHNSLPDSDADLLLEKGHERVIVQCRRFVGNITERDVLNLHSKVLPYGANSAVLISTDPIALSAQRAAHHKPIKLVSADNLYDWLRYTKLEHGGHSKSSWRKLLMVFVTLMTLIVILSAALTVYVLYSQNRISAESPAPAPTVTAELAQLPPTEIKPTRVVLRQTPPVTLESLTPTAIFTPTPAPTESPVPTVAASSDFSINDFVVSPPLTTDLANWPAIPAFTSSFVTNESEEWDGTVDATAVWRLGWDDTFLYGIVLVTDDTHVQTLPAQYAYRGDSLELELDTNNDKTNFAQQDDYQYIISPGNFSDLPASLFRYRGGDNGIMIASAGTEGEISAVDTAVGYTVSFRIPWTDMELEPPTTGTTFGIALTLNDNDSLSTQKQQVQFSHLPSRKWSSPDTWGTLTLK